MTDAKTPPPRILVIEEESTLRTFLGRLFHRQGWDPTLHPSAAEAARQPLPKPAAIVLDLPCEDSDAISALDAVQRTWPGVPTLALIEAPARADAVGLRNYGAVAVVKPFEIGMMVETVRRLVDEGLRTGLNTPRPYRPPKPILW
jgi:DNA-binding response OmpR family regulator